MKTLTRTSLLLLLFALLGCTGRKAQVFDLVIANARVIDPETGTDSLLNVGLIGDKIARISATQLNGKNTIDATGKIVTPGFIDLHAHGQTNIENEYQAFDGVTTALELEVGVDTLAAYYAARSGNALINFGASACQLAYRNQAIANSDRSYHSIFEELRDSAAQQALAPEKFDLVRSKISNAIAAGAIGIGIPVGYLPAASIEEIADIYALAGELGVPIFSHVREGGSIAFQQAISDAVLNNAQLHICHLTSMARKDVDFCLHMVEKAQKLGYPISTELYPYTAANTEIGSAIFNDGWQDRLGCSHHDLQWLETNERLNPESFNKYREQGGSVIIHMMKEEWIDKVVASPVSMIASDGGEYSKNGHPRSSGSFAKVIREFVMEKAILDLPTAIRKMSLMPAQVLEPVVPSMRLRGRVQEGCIADLLVFDFEQVQDNATYENGFVRSSGMEYVIVGGELLIAKGELQKGVFPGRGIKSEVKL